MNKTSIQNRYIVSIALYASILLGLNLPIFAEQAPINQASERPDHVTQQFGHPPDVPDSGLSSGLEAAIQTAILDPIQQDGWGRDQTIALEEITQSDDPRLVWIISDLMRFVPSPQLTTILGDAAAELLNIDAPRQNHWGVITDHLIAWDIAEPPNYLPAKQAIFTGIIPGWDNIFQEGKIDWRMVSWGGVLIDDRPFDRTDEPCNCIPAADNPEVTRAEDATWLQDDAIVFGIRINGEARAYPRQIMEVREMVNDTLGGRHLGIPYCTLCGSAQVYYTDRLTDGVERPILRTSGLLIRSNKVMYDLNTYSVFDTFLGHAVTGPLAELGVKLKQASVVTTDWGTWKRTYPETTVLAEKLALGRNPDFRNGRDANGPIFPVGDVDPRLPAHEDVIGIISPSGTPVAFQRSAAMIALRQGENVGFENINLTLEAGGIKAVSSDGTDLGSHQAFWFAWSQFHPNTILWNRQ